MSFLGRLGGARRKRVEPYGLWAADQEQLDGFVSRGAVVDAARDCELSVSFTNADRAKDAAERLRKETVLGARVRGELVEPSHGVEEWSVLLYGRDQALVPDFLREMVDLAEAVAADHSGEYEGWIAMFTADEKADWGVEPL